MKILQDYYLKPNSYPYLIIEFLFRYKWSVSLCIIALILSYPSYQLVHTILDKNHVILENKTLIQKNIRLTNKLKKLNINTQKIEPLLIHKNIKALLIKNHANIEEILWHKESNNIDLIFNQKFSVITEIIQQINHNKNLYFNQIRLIKMNKDQRVSCVLNLTIL